MNVWPLPKSPHLRELTDVEDVEYEDITESTDDYGVN